MTHKNFQRYCKRNKLIRVVPTDYCIEFFFKGNKRIVVHSGIDGLTYSIWKKPKDGASKRLFNDLNALKPQMERHYRERYGDDGSFLLAQKILGQSSNK